jgi:hypothetical protein
VGKSFDFEIEERHAGELIMSDNTIIALMSTVFVPKKQSQNVIVCSIPLLQKETNMLGKQSFASAQTNAVSKHDESLVSILLDFI